MPMEYVSELRLWLWSAKRLGAMDIPITIPFPIAKSIGKAIGIYMEISLL